MLREFWAEVTPVEGEAECFGDDGLASFEPYGRTLPGLAPAGEPMADPAAVADWSASASARSTSASRRHR